MDDLTTWTTEWPVGWASIGVTDPVATLGAGPDPDAPFRIASISKTMVGLAALVAVVAVATGGGGEASAPPPPGKRPQSRSTQTATPMPPPMHSVARPFLASRRFISNSSVFRTRQPDAPIG